MNTQWWEVDNEILENTPTWALLKTVHGFPVWHNLNTAGFWIVTWDVKKKLWAILGHLNGDSTLIDLLEREFDIMYIEKILHAFYLWLYHQTIYPTSIKEKITTETQINNGYGRLLERIFSHSIDKFSPRFSSFKTPRRIDHGGENSPGLDMVFRDATSGITWWVMMTMDREKATWLMRAQREVDRWAFSDIWYRNSRSGIHMKHPSIYTPNRIMSMKFRHMKVTQGEWTKNFLTWQGKGYVDDVYSDFSPEISVFLREFFAYFSVIMDHINAIISSDVSSRKNGIFAKYILWKMQIECNKQIDGIVIKYWNKDFASPLALTITIPHQNLWIPMEKTGDQLIDWLHASMFHAGWVNSEDLVPND